MNYWLMSMSWGSGNVRFSPCKRKGVAAIGYYPDYETLGNLDGITDKEYKARWLGWKNPNGKSSLWSFVNKMQIGDGIYVRGDKASTIGRGVIAGDYKYDLDILRNEPEWKDQEYPWEHYRAVDWVDDFKIIHESLSPKNIGTVVKLDSQKVKEFEIRHNLQPLEQIIHAKNNTEEIIESTCDITVKEGAEKYGAYTRYERSPKLRAEAIKIHGYTCKVRGCVFNFKNKYGEDFIEVHHIKPLSQTKETDINPATDLITVCSNCHRMIHRKRDKPLKIEELEEMIR